MHVKCMIANTPRYHTFLSLGRILVCLALNAIVHDMGTANCAVINLNIPRPESYGIPLSYFELFFFFHFVECYLFYDLIISEFKFQLYIICLISVS